MIQASVAPPHTKWLHDTKERLKTTDGKEVAVWEFCFQREDDVLSQWASHFRCHYCLDEEIDELRDGTGLSRAEYLKQFIFPDESEGFGPSVRAGDFGEILIADFLEYILGFWVPRTRYSKKDIPNESVKGCDVVGLRIYKKDEESSWDILFTVEVKTQFSGDKANTRLQDAVNDSGKDPTRIGASLNAMKRRLLSLHKNEEAKRISRFQSPEDHPYREVSGAAALFSTQVYDPDLIRTTNCQNHPNIGDLDLLVMRGDDFMSLVHELYRRAADEA